MLWLPLVWLSLTTIVVVSVFALMFWSVAFTAPEQAQRRGHVPAWQMSNLNGSRLHAWAANLARRVVARHAGRPRSSETALAIASELEAGASAALEQAGERVNAKLVATCPNKRPRQIRVTVPEVLAITEELQRTCPKPELQIVREIAVLNARRARFVLPSEFAAAGIGCPLRTPGGYCLTFLHRPIVCRSLCPNCPCPGGGSDDANVQHCRDTEPFALSEMLHEGMTDGLTEGLREAGLDGDVYELNAALATAIDTPQAAVRWSRGESVFAQCVKA